MHERKRCRRRFFLTVGMVNEQRRLLIALQCRRHPLVRRRARQKRLNTSHQASAELIEGFLSRLVREQVAGGDIAVIVRGGQDPEFLVDLIAERDQVMSLQLGKHLKTILLGL